MKTDLRVRGEQLMVEMSALAQKMVNLAVEAETGASGASELEKHQIRRQATIASEAAERSRYWIGQAYMVGRDTRE